MRAIKLVLFLTCILTAGEASAQYRNAEVEYHVLSPSPGDSYKSPSVIQVEFYLVNNGPDTLLATDSFVYFITHGLIYPFDPVKKRTTIGQQLLQGDTSDIFIDSVPLDWEWQRVYSFQFSLLCSYFSDYKASLGWSNLLRVTHPSYQDSLSKFDLVHDYSLGMFPNIDNHQSFTIYPNPSSGLVQIRLNQKDTEHHMSVFNCMGEKVIDEAISNNTTFNIGVSGLYTVIVENMASGQRSVQKIMIR